MDQINGCQKPVQAHTRAYWKNTQPRHLPFSPCISFPFLILDHPFLHRKIYYTTGLEGTGRGDRMTRWWAEKVAERLRGPGGGGSRAREGGGAMVGGWLEGGRRCRREGEEGGRGENEEEGGVKDEHCMLDGEGGATKEGRREGCGWSG